MNSNFRSIIIMCILTTILMGSMLWCIATTNSTIASGELIKKELTIIDKNPYNDYKSATIETEIGTLYPRDFYNTLVLGKKYTLSYYAGSRIIVGVNT